MSSRIQPTGNPSIFVDDPEENNISPEFNNYANALTNMILHSTPKFTIGIFGDWGTGKTTLILNMRRKLVTYCPCILFNAWRFEREKTHATIPLMLTVIEHLLESKDVKQSLTSEKNDEIPKLTSKIVRVLQGLSFYAKLGLPYGAEVGLNYDVSKIGTDQKTITENTLNELREKKPVLQEGVELIEELVNTASGPKINKDLKLVVFIDDLDRCTPEKASEVLESIKIFFDIEGIVFVLGLSTKIVEAAIDFKYKDFSEHVFTGKEYLKKIIQVPFSLPSWEHRDLALYLDQLIKDYSEESYKKFFSENSFLVSNAVDSNPRDVKRLLNNFILAHQMRVDNSVNASELLCLQALLMRWKWFYDEIIHDPRKIEILKDTWFSKTGKLKRNVFVFLGNDKNSKDAPIHPFVARVEKDLVLTRFLQSENAGKIIFYIKTEDWPKYRRTVFSEPNLVEELSFSELVAKKDHLEEDIDKLEKEAGTVIATIESLHSADDDGDYTSEEDDGPSPGYDLNDEENQLTEILNAIEGLKKEKNNIEESIQGRRKKLGISYTDEKKETE